MRVEKISALQLRAYDVTTALVIVVDPRDLQKVSNQKKTNESLLISDNNLRLS